MKYIVAKGNDITYTDYIFPYLPKGKGGDVVVADNSVGKTIFEKYNHGLGHLKKNGLKDNDIICFPHEDIKILDKHHETKARMVFDRFPDIAVLGIIGTTSFPEEGGWWLADRTRDTRGHIMQDRPDLQRPFHMVDKVGFFTDMASVDGCFFYMNGKFAKDYTFDNDTYDGYHFYDCDMSFTALEKGWKVAVADILVEHASEGPMPPTWHINRDKFLKKWISKGIKFPVTINSFRGKV